MFASTLARRLRLCALLTALALLGLPAVSHGDRAPTCNGTGVCTFRFDSGLRPVDAHPVDIPCLTLQEGTATGTGEEAGGGNFDFDTHFGHFHSRYTETGRMDFPSGMYILYSFAAQGGAEFGEQRTTITVTEAAKNRGTVYGPDGQPTGRVVTEHVLIHFAFIDSGDAGIPWDSDPTDDFIVDIDRDRWTCN